MDRKYFIFSLLVTSVFFFSKCKDENRPIVVNSDQEEENNDNVIEAECQFSGVQNEYVACLNNLSEATLDIATWNLEYFPTNGNTTLGLLQDIIPNINADLIAVQEISNISEFNRLVNNLDGWEGEVVNVGGSLDLGYLYKICEIEIIESPSAVLNGSVEPRPAIQTKVYHSTTDLEIVLFNIHLKCCGSTGSSEANRRQASSIALQNYINTSLPNQNVIVLGDWNDDIGDGPFDNFLEDDGFEFADQSIADGPSSDWSYAYSSQYLSHLDHILFSNELADNFDGAETIILDDCISNFSYNISDHRAVLARFK